MKRLLIPLIAVGFMALAGTGCGGPEPPGESPTTEQLLDSAWARYRAGNYEASLATFDSVVVVNADLVEARLGQGFSSSQLSYYSDAHGSFGLINILAGTGVMVDTLGSFYMDTSNWLNHIDTTGYGDRGIYALTIPTPASQLLSLFKLEISYKGVNVVGLVGTTAYIKDDLPFDFGDDTSGILDDSVYVFYTYSYYNPEAVDELVWYSFVGENLTYLAQRDDYTRGILYGKAAYLTVDSISNPAPDRVSSTLDMDKNHLGYALAYTYYRQGWYANAVDVLHDVNSQFPYAGWDISDTADFDWCFDPDNLPSILNEIEGGL